MSDFGSHTELIDSCSESTDGHGVAFRYLALSFPF